MRGARAAGRRRAKRETAILIRADGGAGVGMGHARRCLALAAALAEQGATVVFAVPGEEPLLEAVRRAGFAVEAVPRDEAVTLEGTRALARRLGSGVLVVDSYRTAPEAIAAGGVRCTAVIDDLADRPLPADVVVNGLAGADSLSYRVAKHTRLLLGPRYALLRRQFRSLGARAIAPRVGRVLITTGGEDRAGLVPKLIEAVAGALPEAVTDVVIGPWFTNQETIRATAARWPSRVNLHTDPSDLAELMTGADLAITGGGQTTYELAATGTPAVAIQLADNQERSLRHLSAAGTLTVAGNVADPGLPEAVADHVRHLASHPELREKQSRAGRRLVDGKGAERVAKILLGDGEAP